jgi:hypothetical protein
MKIFICNRSIDIKDSEKVISELFSCSENSVAILRETEHSENWKNKTELKLEEVDFVLFLLGSDTFVSDNLKWEYAKSKQLNKQIIGLKLPNASTETILFCQGFQVFENVDQCLKFLRKVFEDDRQLKLEQYKIMVASTEKVTEQRLKVNNLFFTVTSSIFSIAFVLGKALDFSLSGIVYMFVLTIMAFIVTFTWEKLINSYGNLNTGKFKIIDKIEKQLRTNMFEDEWKVLTKEIKYEQNTKTEVKIIKRFRVFILIASILELAYLGYKLHELCPICYK